MQMRPCNCTSGRFVLSRLDAVMSMVDSICFSSLLLFSSFPRPDFHTSPKLYNPLILSAYFPPPFYAPSSLSISSANQSLLVQAGVMEVTAKKSECHRQTPKMRVGNSLQQKFTVTYTNPITFCPICFHRSYRCVFKCVVFLHLGLLSSLTQHKSPFK